ncbi:MULTISPECIES: anthranilate synthase component II [Candidatus Nitrosocaldus]|jgi:anthranilate synthase component 2|uniref:anthranilate synthase n=1 Tax=Candidatus Nitrosocaldus cavascurensis TaxID=2058097 RepID=A0A2K5AQP1_9ARCH|nr:MULTISPECIES: aminodeoxychorismate/anthranilate synthase component II [Candidatus Nitrosocaldus]SPC33945.1 Aminodeoxychorismate/anthranilate synthase component II [Candidatus Nitrosocaldus cavascurensis]
MRIIIIDNYDSFTYNLAQQIGSMANVMNIGIEPLVFRNDKITLGEILMLDPDAIIISPGPGHPANRRDFGVSADVILNMYDKLPILGVCLGHQGIVHLFGGKVVRAKTPRHGKTSMISHNSKDLFQSIDNPFKATRYHSLVADPSTIPPSLEVTAYALDDDEVMGVRHKEHMLFGVQFHPESILTKSGDIIMINFISMVKR